MDAITGKTVLKEAVPASRAGAPAHPLGYVPAIDGLRAVAVLSVVAYHVDHGWLPGGLAGVDLFFVISGFVVTASLAGRASGRPGADFAAFYARRVVRIVPALAASLLAVFALAMLFIPERGLGEHGVGAGLSAFAGFSNLFLYANLGDYFAPRSALDPFAHTWSLGIEEQFYLLLPLALWLTLRRERGSGAPWRALAAVGLVSAASLLLYARDAGSDPRAVFYLTRYRLWELGAGVLLCLGMPLWLGRLRALRPALAALAWGAGVAGLAWFLVRYPGAHLGMPPLVLPVGASVLLVALCCARPADLPARLLESRPAVAVGLASYSLYLWHWPLLALARWTFGLDTPLKLSATLAAVAFAAFLSYRFVERPAAAAQRAGRLPPRRALVAGPAALAVAAAAAFLLVHYRPISLLTPMPEIRDGDPRGCVTHDARAFAGGTLEAWSPCGGGRSALFVLGDSHAWTYRPLLPAAAGQARRPVRLYYLFACAFPRLAVSGMTPPYCGRFQEAAIRDIAAAARPGDTIFIASRYVAPPGRAPSPQSEAAALREADRLVAALAAAGARLVFEAPKPVFPAAPFRCIDWFNRMNPACRGGFAVTEGETRAMRAAPLAALRRLAARAPGAIVWDPLPLLCPRYPCGAIQQGRFVFLDDNHLSLEGVARVAPSLESALAPPP
ncbi:MAG: acyltransferase [Alphaproteobacteria bacterium]|nr:acyltransferase [Alphaproteobacteria bacterium]MBV9370283.1 acyltransferase [Alphaproteobacteria bacterium]MBV9899768.1 acyltransferase [Alphaproteobacteria bacterium]